MEEEYWSAVSAAYSIVQDRLLHHDYREGIGKEAKKKKKAKRRREKQGRRNSRK